MVCKIIVAINRSSWVYLDADELLLEETITNGAVSGGCALQELSATFPNLATQVLQHKLDKVSQCSTSRITHRWLN